VSTGPSPTSTPSDADRTEDAPADRPGWIALPGGWITTGFGAALAALAATVWHQRRRRYRPTPITAAGLDDADLRPPLNALPAIKRALRQQAAALPAAAEDTHQLPAHHPVAADWTQASASGTGLAGPATDDAARGLLAICLADPARESTLLIVPAPTLTRLGLGTPATERLTVPSTFGEALTHLEEEVIRRSRHLADRAAANDPAEQLAPLLLLLADVPDEQWHDRLTTALQLGAPMAIHAVLLGRWPPGRTMVVGVGGATEHGHLTVLDQSTAADILGLVGAAKGLHLQDVAETPAPPEQQRPAQPASVSPPSDDGAPADTAVPSAHLVRVRVLGQPAILDGDGQPVSGLRAKSLELLVYLAVHRRGAALSDIMEALWPEASTRRAPQRLSTCAANLRGVIRRVAAAQAAPADGGTPAELQPVVNTGGRYHLNPDMLDVDWWRVLDAYAQIAPAAEESAKLHHLRAAVDAGGNGVLADGLDYEWIDTDREHVRRYLVRTYAHAGDLTVNSDPDEARRLAAAAADLDPLSEELARRAMRAAAQADDPAAVRRRLETIRRNLSRAGISLDPETAQLAVTLTRGGTRSPSNG
jgi:DNA-binding SARP family transcriptional activator